MARSLRDLPSVDRLAGMLAGGPHPLAVAAARATIEAARAGAVAGDGAVPTLAELRAAAERRLRCLREGSLRPVINATGVVLHTNLGRAPLGEGAVAQVLAVAAGYSNLELDLESGERGSRQAHVETLIRDLTGAEAALAVNNNAAAVLLALAALAAGREVLVSRGELIEIGGSFRIPEILAQSGARLVEVGTTNRTRLADYEAAAGPGAAAILHVHQSNFRTVGFVEQPPLEGLARLASRRGLALVCDLGSGALAPLADEPVASRAVAAGADLACFSADKLLGGPQAGILAGRAAAVAACRSHPLARAVRLDKLQLAALEATLRAHRAGEGGALPALAMLSAAPAELEPRARRIAALAGPAAEVRTATARPGGGSLPLAELEGPVCSVAPPDGDPGALLARLRRADPPVIARISEGRVVLDPRTMSDAEAELAGRALAAALEG